jgi:hypothetical protein
MIFPSNNFQAVPAAFLANLGALRVSAAKVTNQNFLSSRMNVRHFSWASFNASAAASTLVSVDYDGACILVYA